MMMMMIGERAARDLLFREEILQVHVEFRHLPPSRGRRSLGDGFVVDPGAVAFRGGEWLRAEGGAGPESGRVHDHGYGGLAHSDKGIPARLRRGADGNKVAKDGCGGENRKVYIVDIHVRSHYCLDDVRNAVVGER
jgi:hypothetical protein